MAFVGSQMPCFRDSISGLPRGARVEREEVGDLAHLHNAESTGIAAGNSPAAVIPIASWGVWPGCRSVTSKGGV